MKSESSAPVNARRLEIIDGCIQTFMRYGYKKTSMDDLARSIGLSRQALYLNFSDKATLFKATVGRVIERLREAGQEALGNEAEPIEARLGRAFDEVHGHSVGYDTLDEILETSVQMVGPVFDEFEVTFQADLAKALQVAGVARRWKSPRVTAELLAAQLYAASKGHKHLSSSAEVYRERMRGAIHLVCRSPEQLPSTA
ncbi:TetR/AcrR family transcriptional regulator [Actomonas aquatica]|uniref:TetR/AcrR family transcriptional regulator n=1 Tax=Actomonas aquatica TaxID=2866162 RepID=A0ABZ1C6V8_9BACT|nr:TetR/AcrR family transcriptional regulator [Opitutus sp. WL0086]WRQ87246.1 TetR/AcrR family transcriptional regulator [Opitutus sp. WL0086]